MTSDTAHMDVKRLPANLGSQTTAGMGHACNCIGPQRNEPKCPCLMRNIIERDGRWIQKEVDLGPIVPEIKDIFK